MAGMTEKIEKMLQDMMADAPDIEGAALIGSDGLIIAANLPIKSQDPNRIGASAAALLGLGKRTIEALQKGDFSELSLTGTDGSLYLYSAGPTGILGILAKKGANVGMINMLARDISEKISQMLE